MMQTKALRRAALTAIAAAALCMQAASAEQITVAEVQAMKKRVQTGSFSARAEWNALSFYLQGAMEAIGLAQGELERADARTLFCPPPGGSLDIRDLYAILESAPPAAGPKPALGVLLSSIQKRYPCKG